VGQQRRGTRSPPPLPHLPLLLVPVIGGLHGAAQPCLQLCMPRATNPLSPREARIPLRPTDSPRASRDGRLLHPVHLAHSGGRCTPSGGLHSLLAFAPLTSPVPLHAVRRAILLIAAEMQTTLPRPLVVCIAVVSVLVISLILQAFNLSSTRISDPELQLHSLPPSTAPPFHPPLQSATMTTRSSSFSWPACCAVSARLQRLSSCKTAGPPSASAVDLKGLASPA
jgi:hypothetical protein